jgi:hypothetical protein
MFCKCSNGELDLGAYKPSAISIFEDHAVIHLNTGFEATIDIEDVDLVKAFSWRVHPNGTGNIYASTKHLGRTLYLHRFLMKPPVIYKSITLMGLG